MPAAQLVLTGVPAFVGAVTGSTTVRFFIDENEFNPASLIDVDLARNTSLPPAQWATGVDCDTQTAGGHTTIGPTFHAGLHVGAVYLAERIRTARAAVLAAWPPAPDALYQYQAVLRADNNNNVTRYHGFKVQVLSPAQGSLVHIALINVGAAAPTPDGPVRWMDLADASMCDPRANGFTTIDPTSPTGTIGAVFMTAHGARVHNFDYPKVPRGLGW